MRMDKSLLIARWQLASRTNPHPRGEFVEFPAGYVEFFRRSELLVHEDEFAGALRAYAFQERMGPYVWSDTDHWIRLGLNWKLVRRDEPELVLCDCARVLNWGSGHAYGMLGLHVQLPSTGGIILASDAIYCAANYGPPVRPQGEQLVCVRLGNRPLRSSLPIPSRCRSPWRCATLLNALALSRRLMGSISP
jgi:hypothetical protein